VVAPIEVPTLGTTSPAMPAGESVPSITETKSEEQPLAQPGRETVSEGGGTDSPIVKAATTVPRGESLTREQIAEHVRQLESLARSTPSVPQRSADSVPPRPDTPSPGQ
jgi:hypothetical protein